MEVDGISRYEFHLLITVCICINGGLLVEDGSDQEYNGDFAKICRGYRHCTT